MRRWSLRLIRPTLVLDVTAGQDVALAQAVAALRARRFRVHAAPGPARVEAERRNWWTLLSEMLPERWLVDVTAVPGGSGTLLRWTFVRGGYDGALARCAPRLVDDAVGRLRALGVEVTVGEWESSVPSR